MLDVILFDLVVGIRLCRASIKHFRYVIVVITPYTLGSESAVHIGRSALGTRLLTWSDTGVHLRGSCFLFRLRHIGLVRLELRSFDSFLDYLFWCTV